MENDLVRLAVDLVRIDSRSPLSNIAVADRIEAELSGFEVERLDYTDAAGVQKRCLVAHRGGPGGFALSGHMDTVPNTGWTDDPWSGRVADGILHGLGSVDMKANVAAAIMAAKASPRATLLITTDEETTKQGARTIAEHSVLAKRAELRGTIVAEPTGLIPVRGHRAHIAFTATAEGVQAHSSTGKGTNANWALIPFLVEVKAMFERLRNDASLQDPAYDPPFSDFNLVIDNHGTAVNVTAAKATARIKFRYSHRIDPTPVVTAMRDSAQANGLTLEEMREGRPPELPVDHPLIQLASRITGQAPRTAPYGTDASELQAVAPCVIMGPGSIEFAHTPHEQVPVAELARAVTIFQSMLQS
ncbi:M20/M25/M40 family metallo-hydrolase [Roseococcus pinisoli]|uniref:M20/M25/M40 family metallo-hydrolase n=1 Tax=Roseococcus pinisoli TaxID=2835040 RepID=A0ABS5QDE0_9PROT|nr:M20/M25/M40 family metallo-hydrolase [Roseococcus pinisoli]MBS7810952.1 M20/M25/M40 family metallo-hydrolase [Roseococcus pinisoli]